MLCEDAIEELYTSCLISKQKRGPDRNQTTINSPEWLNTKRLFFRTNSPAVYLGVRLPVLVNTLLVIPF